MSVDSSDLESEIEALKQAMAVQEANMAGKAATDAATHAGTWSTMLAGGVALVVGMFLGLTVSGIRR